MHILNEVRFPTPLLCVESFRWALACTLYWVGSVTILFITNPFRNKKHAKRGKGN